MTMNGRRFKAAISSQFVVAPNTHGGLVALRLAKAFLDGPQDLSLSDEANDTSRKIWEGLGGATALLHSLYWTRPLRPARLALSIVRRRPRLAPLAIAAAPLAFVVDALTTRLARRHVYALSPDVTAADELTTRTVLACLPRWTRAESLRVDYDEPTLGWLLDLARRRKRSGSLRATVIRKSNRVIGWYLYHLDRDRIANVLHLMAEPARIREVLEQLFQQAEAQGAIAVTGRVEPRDLQALTDRYCVLHRHGPWVLLNTKHPDLLRSFQTGEASFSRFDGEWCLGF
jgi:hypothetical protein